MRSTELLLICLCHLIWHFNGHFPRRPWLDGTRMSRFWSLLELRMMEVVVTTGAIRHAKLQSNHHHRHPVFYRPDALPVTRPKVSEHWREISVLLDCCVLLLTLWPTAAADVCRLALEAMKKAHELEMERERKRFADELANSHNSTDLQSLQKQHEYITLSSSILLLVYL